ncbi:MAG: N(4)-(beta-N-acetylglucosaminyl)-L-asparaginase [Saprospiraceae bacterium]|nr:N(4)-(beta-N-acetylglucosaminyl)-L-asparaginase [Saprospiraceae bacterium]
MFNRRKFITNATLGTVAIGTGLIACQPSEKAPVQKKNPNSKEGFPIVIATWNPNIKATEAAWQALENGGTSLDAVEAGAKVPEADPNDTSVGYGGAPDRDGFVTLDACIMDKNGNAGSVTFLQGIKHPISVARLVMEKTPHVMLSGDGALQFALENGFQKENLLTENAKKAWEKWLETNKYEPKADVNQHDTIGILAIDKNGDIAGACTTSGMAYKLHGRVGDSPIIGAGMYVDNEIGGACATGVGELVMKTLGSFLIVELMRQGMTPQEACEEATARIAKRYGDTLPAGTQVGYLAINKKGEHGAFSLVKGFNYALYQVGGENLSLDADALKS